MATSPRRKKPGTVAALPKGFVPPPRFEENIPIHYADGFEGGVAGNGVVKLNLFADVGDPFTRRPTRRVVAHLALPVPAVVAFHAALGLMIEQFQQQGFVSTPQPDPSKPKK
jgi:hypothetical protein